VWVHAARGLLTSDTSGTPRARYCQEVEKQEKKAEGKAKATFKKMFE
jgi:hypothetical protein